MSDYQRPCPHERIRQMTWQEAYPAVSGVRCLDCGLTHRGWFCDVTKFPEADDVKDFEVSG